MIGIYDHHPETALKLSRRFHPALPLLSRKQIVSRSQLLIEAASSGAVAEFLPEVIRQRKSMLVLSTGGLVQNPQLLRKAAARNIPIYLPSGALAGLDGIKAGSAGTLHSVTLMTRKPPAAFSGAPEVKRRGIRLSRIRRARVLFEGPASKAVRAFPQNINVAATLALAGLGSRRTRVKIVADPLVRQNIHEVEAIGDFGRLRVRVENKPAPENPKTSRLAVLSAIATLKQILQPIRVGT